MTIEPSEALSRFYRRRRLRRFFVPCCRLHDWFYTYADGPFRFCGRCGRQEFSA